jgi:hypothetical protein
LHKDHDVYFVEETGDPSSAMLWQMIQRLKIRCDGRHSEGGCCSWTGEIGAFRHHLQSGTCGLDLPIKDSETQAQWDTVDTVRADEIEKDIPRSPSTCSLGSIDPFSAEDSSAECDSKSSEMDSTELPDSAGMSTPIAYEAASCEPPTSSEVSAPLGEDTLEDLTSLIQSLVDARVHEHVHGHAHLLSAPVAKAAQQLDDAMTVPRSAPKQNTPAASFSSPSTKGKAASKPKAKKEQTQKTGQDMVEAVAARQWHAYQWQAAQYQMAYARQYQMSVYAAQMQHAMQYQRQFNGRV